VLPLHHVYTSDEGPTPLHFRQFEPSDHTKELIEKAKTYKLIWDDGTEKAWTLADTDEDKSRYSLQTASDLIERHLDLDSDIVPEVNFPEYNVLEGKCNCSDEAQSCKRIQGSSDWFTAQFGCAFAQRYNELFELGDNNADPIFNMHGCKAS
jgi:hypothetical protein